MSDDEPLIDDTDELAAEEAAAAEARPDVIEHYRAEEVTLLYRLKRLAARAAGSALTSALLALILFPIICFGIITIDLPATLFDGWSSNPALKPSQWLSRGDLILSFSFLVLILMTRRYGGAVTARALGFAWIIMLLTTVILLLYKAPELTAADLPNGRFLIGLVAGWYGGAWLAIRVYDLTRGSRWYRPPFLALGCGFVCQSLVTIPVTYAGTGLPWTWWLGANVVIQVFLTVVYVSLYRLLRARFHPKASSVTGYGGR